MHRLQMCYLEESEVTALFRSHSSHVGSCAVFRRTCVNFGSQVPGRDGELNYVHCILKLLLISSI